MIETKIKKETLDMDSFDLEFAGPVFTEDDRVILRESVREMRGTDIEFELAVINGKIEPLSLLIERMAKNPNIGDINIVFHDRTGNVVGTKTYEQCHVFVSEFADHLAYTGDTTAATMRLTITGYKSKKFCGTEISS